MEIVTTSTSTRKAPRKRASKKKKKTNNNSNRTVSTTTRKEVKAPVARPTFCLSKCSTDYLKVLTTPFVVPKELPCVPDLLDRPTQKLRFLQRGTFNSGTTGFGFVLMDLYRFFTTDADSILTTNSTYAVSSITNPANATVTLRDNSQAYWTTAAIGPGSNQVQFRPVAGGLRVRYMGTELNRSGRSVPFRSPDNQPLSNFTTATALAFPMTRTRPTSRQWVTVNWLPSNLADYEYKTSMSVTDPPLNGGSIAIMVDGTVASSAFEYEMVAYYEVSGSVSNQTRSHSDLQGMSSVRDFIENINSGSTPKGDDTMWSEAMKYFKAIKPADISGWIQTGKQVNQLMLEL